MDVQAKISTARPWAKGIFLLAAVLISGAGQADDMVRFERAGPTGMTTSLQNILHGTQSQCARRSLMGSQAELAVPEGMTSQLLVQADAVFDWSVQPACSADPVDCTTSCGGPFGHEDFDQSWGPLQAPPGLQITLGWQPNGCTSSSGQLEFYIVPDACGGSGTLVHSVSGDLGVDADNFTLSASIDLSGIVTEGQNFFLRVVEVSDQECGGVDYHIGGFALFAEEEQSLTCDLSGDGRFDAADVLIFTRQCRD